MNEFNFRVARAASQEITVPSDATKKTFTIHSYRDTVVNGKVSKSDIIDFTTNIVYDPPVSSSNAWVFTKKTANDAVSYNLEVDIFANSDSSSRTATITLTQATSGKTISFPISQEPNFTYTYFLGVLNVSSTVGANIGATTTIMVQSYMTRSDGEKMAKQPSVGATPSFASKVTVKDGSVIAGAPHWYQIVVEATAANIGSSERSEILLVTCGDQRKEVTICQKAAEQDITLTIHWPLDTNSAAFFKEGQTPQSGSTSIIPFSFPVLDGTSVHRYKKSEGIIVNLQDGNTEIAYPGDRISAYRFINQAWQFRSTFILPSSDQSITL